MEFNENWRKRYNKEVNKASVWRLDILSFVRKILLNWIGHVNSLETKRKVIEVVDSTPHGRRLRGHPKTDGGIVYKQILINAEFQIQREVKEQS